ncbi:MAG: hypothetical protein AB8F94_07015 [Saprospiraceae bacterium]
MRYINNIINVPHFYFMTNTAPLLRILSLFIFTFLMGNAYAQVEDKQSENTSPDGMNNKKMEAIFKSEVEELEGELGNWQMNYGGSLILVLTDEKNNRMRIFTPVVEKQKLKEGQLEKMLEANFHSALDSKYSLYNRYVVSVFTHPLKELGKDQLIDAMRQVVILSRTFGDTYSSTGLIFGGGTTEEGEKKENPKKKLKKM